jgi:hypothetical protein
MSSTAPLNFTLSLDASLPFFEGFNHHNPTAFFKTPEKSYFYSLHNKENDDFNNTVNIENHLKNMYFIKMLGCAYQNMVSNTQIFQYDFNREYEDDYKYFHAVKRIEEEERIGWLKSYGDFEKNKRPDSEIRELYKIKQTANLYYHKLDSFFNFIKNYYNKRLIYDYLNSFVEKVDFKKHYHSIVIKNDEIHLIFKNTRRKKGSEKDTHQIEKSIIEGKYKYTHRPNKIFDAVNGLYDEFINIKMSKKIILCGSALSGIYIDELQKKHECFLFYGKDALHKHFKNCYFKYGNTDFFNNI